MPAAAAAAALASSSSPRGSNHRCRVGLGMRMLLLAALSAYLASCISTLRVHHDTTLLLSLAPANNVSVTGRMVSEIIDGNNNDHHHDIAVKLKEQFMKQREKAGKPKTNSTGSSSGKVGLDLSTQKATKEEPLIIRPTPLPMTTISNHTTDTTSVVQDGGGSAGERDSFFVSYQLHYDQPYNLTFGHQTTCKVGTTTNKWGRNRILRVPLAPAFRRALEVTATVATNLKIISVGDSVGMQFHQVLEEAAGITHDIRRVYHNAWGEHESVSVSCPTRGGGVLAAFRMTGMFLLSGKGRAPPNAGPQQNDGAGGWLPEHVEQILNHHTRPSSGGSDAGSHRRVQVGSYDAMIYRIPHGWLSLDKITRASLTESLLLAHELFKVRTVIVLTNHFNNNVRTEQDLKDLRNTNKMIRDTVHMWSGNATLASLIPTVMVMDFGAWTDTIIRLNAQLAGYDTTTTSSSSSSESQNNYTLARLGGGKYPPSVAMACADRVDAGSRTCTRNMLTIDGMHWCMESLGGRIVAGLACLLQCSLEVTKRKENDDDLLTDGRVAARLRLCEGECNNRFMSLSNASDL